MLDPGIESLAESSSPLRGQIDHRSLFHLEAVPITTESNMERHIQGQE